MGLTQQRTHRPGTKPNVFNQRLLLALHLGAWLDLLSLYALLFHLFYPLGLSVWRALLNMAPMVVIFYANLFLVDRFLERCRYLAYFILTAAMLAFFVMARVKPAGHRRAKDTREPGAAGSGGLERYLPAAEREASVVTL